MGVQRRFHRPVEFDFPPDFPDWLMWFKEAGGVSTKALARRLGISPYQLRRWWTRGVAPSSAHLFLLLTLAGEMGLRDAIQKWYPVQY